MKQATGRPIKAAQTPSSQVAKATEAAPVHLPQMVAPRAAFVNRCVAEETRDPAALPSRYELQVIYSSEGRLN